MENNNFKYLLQLGQKAEKVIEDLLIYNGYKVQDVSDNEYYRSIDVDRLVTTPKGKEFRMEIKSDSKISTTKNFFFEKGFDRQTGYYKGWLSKCEADVLCMYDSVNNIAYMLKWDRTKEYVLKNGTNRQFWNYGDCCQGYSITISVAEAERNDLILKVYNLKDGEHDVA